MNWIVREQDYNQNMKQTARTKARIDLDEILTNMGARPLIVEAPQAKRDHAGMIKSLAYHSKVKKCWERYLRNVASGDVVFLQYPVINHTLYLGEVFHKLKSRNIRVVAYLHDLEYLRHARRSDLDIFHKYRIKKEELTALEEFDKIIVHNDAMLDFIHENIKIEKERMIPLGIFDYLIDDDCIRSMPEINEFDSCIIAGNLSKIKSGYIYRLPTNFKFELYGPHYDGKTDDMRTYHGSFPSNDLPKVLKGGFGLVWDGDSIETCSGIWGEYLRYNNPHKTSLYLACGIPVVVWKEAAIAEFIIKNGVGVTVNSLTELDSVIRMITEQDYLSMKKNAREMSTRLRNGFYTIQAANKAMVDL